jgi:hypothetical protein
MEPSPSPSKNPAMLLYQKYSYTGFLITAITLLSASCKKWIQIPPPKNTIVTEQVFQDEAQAEGAMSGLYTMMINGEAAGAQPGIASNNYSAGYLTVATGQSSDELFPYRGSTILKDYLLATNKLTGLQDEAITPLWNSAYKTIYNANSIIEGIAATESGTLSDKSRRELTAEAKFVRALSYFYLTNLFGDLPLALTIDFHQTVQVKKSTQEQVYEQIIKDLKEAISDMPSSYERGKGERIRPNKWAATAFLARVYLYQKDYPAAAATATEVINEQVLYKLEPDLNKVFRANSTEAIWQLKQATTTNIRDATPEGYILLPTTAHKSAAFYCLTDQLLQAFEAGDKRRGDWVDSTDNSLSGSFPPALTFYPAKYKIGGANFNTGMPAEYYMVIRLAEMYLIRAEAAAHGALGGPADGVNDLNEIRRRAGLDELPSTITQEELMTAIEKERQVELFCEWAHRWMDLKRTGRAHDVLSGIPMKQPWAGDHQFLYPIPRNDRRDNPLLSQNEGY